MNLIINKIDELLDCFPVNSITQKMRMDLINATTKDYDTLINLGNSREEASDTIIEQIASQEVMATMISNSKNRNYIILWVLSIIVMIFSLTHAFDPNFLQIFLPTRMEFPDIISKFILYFFSILASYALIDAFYRLLPQKYISRNTIQSAIFLYIGTLMVSIYFSVAVAFIWYTFNGFNATELTSTLVGGFIYSFYNLFFNSKIMVVIYSFINAGFFVFSNHNYHLDTKPQPYDISKIYTPLNADDINGNDYEPALDLVEEVLELIQII